MRRIPLLACVLLLPLLSAAPARADDDPLAAARAAFQAAYAAVEVTPAITPAEDGAALQAYPLYPYLQAARLERDLLRTGAVAAVIDKQIAAFLLAHGNEPVSRDLLRIWLINLADRKLWAPFLKQYREAVADDNLRCDALVAQVTLHRTKQLAPDVIARWLSPHQSPASCEPAFAWLRTTKQLTPALVEQRARLALGAGDVVFARELAKSLTPARIALLEQWAQLIEQPQQAIDALIAKPELPVEPAALLSGWTRLTRHNADAALQRYDELLRARHLDGDKVSPYARALALGLAWSRQPQALDYFGRIAAIDDDVAAEWQVRAALHAGDWTRAASAIAAMPQEQRAQPVWQYFAARADEQLKRPDAARAIYAQLAAGNGYYAALAAARSGQAFAPHPHPTPFDDAQIAQLEQRAGIIRARELFFCSLKLEAGREWLAALDELSAAQRLQTIALAHRWTWYDEAVATASRVGVFDDYALLYPRPYGADVRAASTMTGVDGNLIYGVMRQESLFRADVVSHAGALGLLQLVPDTARRTAQRWRLPLPERAQLLDPAVNIPLGAAELRDLLDSFGGQVPLTLAAYNAGRGAVMRWLPGQPLDTDIWIENIPYNETRTYVQRVLWHKLVFAWQDSGLPQSTQSWLAPVQAAAADNSGGTQ